MVETAQQYIARIIGCVGDRDPGTVLAETPSRLQALVAGASADELRWTTSPTRWSIHQIVAHLADAEIVGAWRVRSALAQDGVALQAYDQNVWASAFHYDTAPAADSAALFGALRAATCACCARSIRRDVSMRACTRSADGNPSIRSCGCTPATISII